MVCGDEIRIVYVIATLDRGGTETQLVKVATGLRRPPFRPRVIALTRGGDLQAELLASHVSVEILGKRHKLDIDIFVRLYRRLKALAPHIVHTWLFTANSYGRAAGVLARVPVLIASERSLDPWKNPLHHLVDGTLGAFTQCIVVNAHAVRERVGNLHPFLGRKTTVIYNGVPALKPAIQAATMRDRLGIPRDARVLVSMGRLSPEKGFADLLYAFRIVSEKMDDAYLLIVGRGEEGQRLEALCSRLGLGERVRFLGEQSCVPDILRAADLFVLASIYEGLPNTVLEAMQVGVPVVATAVGGVPEALQEGEAGVLVPPGSQSELAVRILWLLERPAQRKRFVSQAKEWLGAQFGLTRMIGEYERLYLALMDEHSRKG